MKHLKTTTGTVLFCFLSALPLLSFSQQTIAEWNFPNNPDNAVVDIAAPVNAGITISSLGGTSAVGFGQAGATTFSANATTWTSGANTKWWEITFVTTGFKNLTVSSKQFSSSTGPRDFKIQYRIGAGAWTDLPGATAIVLAANFTVGVVSAVPLPATCDNQPSISLRWIMTTNTSVGLGTVAAGGNSRIDDINVSWNSDDYYRSVMTGDWSNVATWESSVDNITFNPAAMPPSNFAKTITVRNPHTVTVNSNVSLDETTVENGATLHWFSFFITIANGAGVDLQIDGTLLDAASNNVTFNAGATWAVGGAGTVIKTNLGSAVNWSNNYSGGISTIPASATWIIRKVNGNNPSVASLNMYYPNLIIENNTGSPWIATGPSSFQGAAGTIVIKGFMDVGGSGSNFVEFENTNTNATATVVTGNLTIRAGNTLRNYGTGFDLYSNLICDGNLTYDANGNRRIIFSGNVAQTVSGAGNLNVFNLVMNKSGNDLTLLRPLKVDNNVTFNNPGGRIFSTTANILIVENNATSTGANNTSFVHGPVQKLGSQLFSFPTGKNNNYQPIAIGAGAGGGGGTFWTEDFASGCNTGQLASSFSGVNGLWSIANTGSNDPGANTFYVSAAENGQGVGVCGAACGSNMTLHLSSTYLGDLGAAYYESTPGFCPGFFPCSYTDKRAESPVINCSGQSTITLNFNYMEFGDGANDNATLWYFDGASWSQLADMAKTLCCGNVTCNGSTQGLWNAYSIALPASANNNANVRLGFRWINNADGIGTDPSFAVDDIRLTTSGVIDAFTAEYFRGNPQTVFNNNVNPFIDHISQCEYWNLTQDAGSSNRTVTLAWNANSCGVNTLADLTVARFNGLSWDDRGNGGTTGNTTAGTVISAAAQTAYGPFTLASTTVNNPLPVELISLDANFKNEHVFVEWRTASELNSDYFLIERSINGVSFENIGSVKAAGNSSTILNYNFNDRKPVQGISYYRLRQVDFDGTEDITKSVVVKSPHISGTISIDNIFADHTSHNIYVNIFSEQQTSATLEIIDGVGKVVKLEKLNLTDGINFVNVPSFSISKGVYFMRVLTDRSVVLEKFGF